MSVSSFKYLSPVIIYCLSALALSLNGWVTWAPMLYAWVLLPAMELLLNPDNKNMSAAAEELAKANKWYDYMLYVIVPLQYAVLIYFLLVKRGDST